MHVSICSPTLCRRRLSGRLLSSTRSFLPNSATALSTLALYSSYSPLVVRWALSRPTLLSIAWAIVPCSSGPTWSEAWPSLSKSSCRRRRSSCSPHLPLAPRSLSFSSSIPHCSPHTAPHTSALHCWASTTRSTSWLGSAGASSAASSQGFSLDLLFAPLARSWLSSLFLSQDRRHSPMSWPCSLLARWLCPPSFLCC